MDRLAHERVQVLDRGEVRGQLVDEMLRVAADAQRAVRLVHL